MKETSIAIHPGKKSTIQNDSFYDIGNFVSYSKKEDGLSFICEQGNVHLAYYREDIVRVTMNPNETPSRKSTFAVVIDPIQVRLAIIEKEDMISITSSKVTVAIQKKPFRIRFYDEKDRLIVGETLKGMGYNNKNEVICFKEMDDNDHFYGFGEKTGFLDKRNEKLVMWNSDVYAPHNPETNELYQSIPYFLSLRNGMTYGIYFDNSFKSIFDLKTEENTYSFYAEGGQLDYYFMAGPHPKQVLEQYTALTGRMPIPPKWALGYQQSRYSYETEEEVRQLASTFIEKNIPIDVIYLDIHYMNEYRVFTFDKNSFPTVEKMIKDLKQIGIRVVPIVDPGVKEDPEYSIYQEGIYKKYFCSFLEGNLFYGDVWPGNSAFPDFTNTKVREWWGEKHQYYTDMGIEGIWNDMNEPAVFNESKTMDIKVIHDNDGDPRTHKEMHNLYGMMMGEATYHGMKKLLNGKRPFLLTRSGFAGIQRYSAVWTGDNRSFWEHLSMAIPMLMNLGISGVPFIGTDVGGFAHDTTGELLTRWTQLGAFTPYFRNHTSLDTARQEPWSYGDKYETIIKKYIQLRYQWIPHFYTLFAEAHKTGLPIIRPLFLEYPEDRNTWNLSDQFMIGEDVIIAPILQPDTKHRVVYLPEGTWYDYWSNKPIEGGEHILINADLDTLPIFIKAGAIIAHGPIKQSTKQLDAEITFHLYPSIKGKMSYTFYEDDGETYAYEQGKYLEKKITCHYDKQEVQINIEDIVDNYQPTWEKLTLAIHHMNNDINILLNGKQINKNLMLYDEKARIIKIDFIE